MTPSAVTQLRVADETIAEIRLEGWSFEVGEVAGNVYLRARCLGSPGLFQSRMYWLEQRSNRLQIAGLAFEAAKSTLAAYVASQFTWRGDRAFYQGL